MNALDCTVEQHLAINNEVKKSFIKILIAKFEKISMANSFFYKMYSAPYTGVLNREIKLANINEKDTVLNVGCGGMPFTAIYIAKKTGARVIAIDIDKNAINTARQTIKNYNLENKISLVHVDGKHYPFENFNKALIALQASPKNDILNSLAKKIKNNGMILFRQAREKFNHQYDMLDTHQNNGFVKHKMLTFDRTYLFVCNKDS